MSMRRARGAAEGRGGEGEWGREGLWETLWGRRLGGVPDRGDALRPRGVRVYDTFEELRAQPGRAAGPRCPNMGRRFHFSPRGSGSHRRI